MYITFKKGIGYIIYIDVCIPNSDYTICIIT